MIWLFLSCFLKKFEYTVRKRGGTLCKGNAQPLLWAAVRQKKELPL